MKKIHKILLLFTSIILILFIANNIRATKLNKYLINNSDNLRLISNQIKDFKVNAAFITDKLEAEEGYKISINNKQGFLFIVESIPPQIDEIVSTFNGTLKTPEHVVINNRYIFIFDHSQEELLNTLQEIL